VLRVYFDWNEYLPLTNGNVQLLITLKVCVMYSGQGARLQPKAWKRNLIFSDIS